MSESARRVMLIDTVAILAASADEQLRHLETLGFPNCIDELALEFDVIAPAGNDMVNNGEISAQERDAAFRLSEYLDLMSGSEQSQLWTPTALRFAEEWKNVRALARECLRILTSRS